MGRDPPPQFFERPEPAPHLREYWSAFFDLTTERQIGMGLGPIPSSKIRVYARKELDLDGDLAERFFAIIRKVDDEYVSLSASKSKAKSDKPLRNEVAATDVTGMKQMFSGMKSAKPRRGLKKTKAKS